MELESDSGGRLKMASPPPSRLPIRFDDSKPCPFVLRGEPINLIDLLFPDYRKYLIKRVGKKDIKVPRKSLIGKTIVLYLVPMNVEMACEPWDTLDILDAYNEFSRITKNTVFVFVAVEVVRPSHLPEWLRPPEPEYEEQMSLFHRIINTLPFPTIPFEDQPARQRVADSFKLHRCWHHDSSFLPYWSIINRKNTVVASITDPGCFHFFHSFSAEELHPLTRRHLRAVTRQSGRPRDVLSNLDQLLESFNRDFLLSSKGKKVSVSSLKDKVIGFYTYDMQPDPEYMDLTLRVSKEAADQNLDFQIVQMCVRFHPTTGLDVTPIEHRSPQPSVPEHWLDLPFKDPRCKKLLRIISAVYKQYRYDDDSVYGHLVIFQPKRDTFEFCGTEILQEYGIKGYPFTRERLFEVEREIVKDKMRLPLLFPPGMHNLKMRGEEGDKYVPIDNNSLYGKKVLVFYAFPSQFERCAKFISMLKSKYDSREFEVVYVSFTESWDSVDLPWLVYTYSFHFVRKLCRELFRRLKKVKYGQTGWEISGVAAFGEDGELITKFYCLDNWSDQDKCAMEFPFVSSSLEEAIRDEVCSICKLDKYSPRLDEYYPEFPFMELLHPRYNRKSGKVDYPELMIC